MLNARLQALNSVHYNLKIILQREILVNVTQKRFKDPKIPPINIVRFVCLDTILAALTFEEIFLQ